MSETAELITHPKGSFLPKLPLQRNVKCLITLFMFLDPFFSVYTKSITCKFLFTIKTREDYLWSRTHSRVIQNAAPFWKCTLRHPIKTHNNTFFSGALQSSIQNHSAKHWTKGETASITQSVTSYLEHTLLSYFLRAPKIPLKCVTIITVKSPVQNIKRLIPFPEMWVAWA